MFQAMEIHVRVEAIQSLGRIVHGRVVVAIVYGAFNLGGDLCEVEYLEYRSLRDNKVGCFRRKEWEADGVRDDRGRSELGIALHGGRRVRNGRAM